MVNNRYVEQYFTQVLQQDELKLQNARKNNEHKNGS
jgi:hypothetical protein